MEINKGTFTSRYDSLDISFEYVCPQRPIAIVQLVHGMVEHKERYEPFMQYLASRGCAVVIHDHRGHGKSVKSPDDLGYFYSGGWRAMVEDAHDLSLQMRNQIVADGASLPFFLFGHSMGSLVVRSYAKRYDNELSGLIVCGCPSDNWGKGIGRFVADHFFSGHSRPTLLKSLVLGPFERRFAKEGIRNAWVSRNRKNVEAYNADPQCQFPFTANAYSNLFSLMADVYDLKSWLSYKQRNVSLLILFVSGSDDPCMISRKNFNEAVDFMWRAGYVNVSSHLFEGLRHEILNEGDISVYEFIAERIIPST